MAITLVGSSGNYANASDGASFSITISSGAVQSGDIIFVSYAVPRSISMAVLSSDGTPYTQIGGTISQGNCFQSCWYRIATSNETIAVCSGTGNVADAAVATSLVFRTFDPFGVIGSNSTTGNSSTPDSPSVTVGKPSDVVISAVSNALYGGLSAPGRYGGGGYGSGGYGGSGGYTNIISYSQTDTNPISGGMGWVTATSSGPFDPIAWQTDSSGDWIAFSLTLESTGEFTTFDLTPTTEALPFQAKPSIYHARPVETFVTKFSSDAPPPVPDFGWHSELAPRPRVAASIYPSRQSVTPLIEFSTAAGNDPFFDGWYRDFIHREKVEKPFLHPSGQGGTVFPYYFGGVDLQNFGWFVSLSMPVRAKPPLGAWRMPFFTIGVGYVQFSFNISEIGDTASLRVTVNPGKNLARVAIAELQSYTAQVTLEEIKYTRGYS